MAAIPINDEAGSFAKNLGTSIVTFHIGAGSTTRAFAIHKNLLSQKAPRLDTLFNGPFLEGQTQLAILDEEDPDAFELFVSWVYLGEIDARAKDITFVNLFAFAEKYNLTALADHTMDSFLKIFDKKDKVIGPNVLALGYQKTHVKSKLRLFLARSYVYVATATATMDGLKAKTGWTKEDLRATVVESEDLWSDTFNLMRAQSGKTHPNPAKARNCDYHQHGGVEKCPQTPANPLLIPRTSTLKSPDDSILLEANRPRALAAQIMQLRNMFPSISIIKAHELILASRGILNDAADLCAAEQKLNSSTQPAQPEQSGLSSARKRRR